MKIKTKLYGGVGILFFLVLLLASVGMYNLYQLKNAAVGTVSDNYNSLRYCRNMLGALEDTQTSIESFEMIDDNYAKQRQNITESGEEELTIKLGQEIQRMKGGVRTPELIYDIRNTIYSIMDLNMSAIHQEEELAIISANRATVWIAISGTLSFIVAFILLLNLPGSVVNPVRELTVSIQDIAARNYTRRLHFDRDDEFGDLANAFNVMAEKLQEYEHSNLDDLLTEKKRIETLINNMHDPVIGLDEQNRIVFINHEALKVTGLVEAEVLGKAAQEIALHNDLLRLLIAELFIESKGVKDIVAKPIRIYADDKESYFDKEVFEIAIKPAGEDEQRLIGYVILLKNVTPFKELDIAKTNFIATVSHELKTPISSLMMSLKLLEKDKQGGLNDDQKSLIVSMKEDSERLLKITGELLNLSQAETGNIRISLAACDPHDVISKSIEAVLLISESREIKLETSVALDIRKIHADLEKTCWVLINFLTNALRYSPIGSTILIGVQEENNMIRFGVRDQGKGILPEHAKKVFERYYQVPGSEPGTGIGLAICREFIEAQGGKIGVFSSPNQGSEFYFLLPKSHQ